MLALIHGEKDRSALFGEVVRERGHRLDPEPPMEIGPLRGLHVLEQEAVVVRPALEHLRDEALDAPRMEGRNVLPTVVATTSPTAYVRFHGRNAETWNKRVRSAAERFDYLYSEDELREWAEPLSKLAAKAENVYAMFNNNGRSTIPSPGLGEHAEGEVVAQAPVNAQMLRGVLEREGLGTLVV